MEDSLSNRHFRAMTDQELFDWRPETPRGLCGWANTAGANVSAANREMRRRAKLAGLAGPYEWLQAITSKAQPHD